MVKKQGTSLINVPYTFLQDNHIFATSTYLPTSQIDPCGYPIHGMSFHWPFVLIIAQSSLFTLFGSPKQKNHPIKLFENTLYLYINVAQFIWPSGCPT